MAAAAARYVSLVPSLTETLFELGVGEAVVGATKFCVHPRPAVDAVPRVGGTKDPRVDRILALSPTLVLVNQEENRLEDVERLRAAGLEVHVTFPRRVADVPPMLRDLGELVGRPERGEELAADVEAAIEEVRGAALGRAPVPFAVLVWRKPWLAAGPGTFLSDLVTVAGGVNVIPEDPDGARYPEVVPERLEGLAPRRVLLPSEPFPFGELHRDELRRRARIDEAAFLGCDGQLLTWHGSRTAAGLRAAARWLHQP
ncbi:MAG: helical backbone metal receptor [Planctomycetota bacterium]|nr:helical backbone metal receptor [Planctomycetota bacterium]